MQRLEVSDAVRLMYKSLGVKGLNSTQGTDEAIDLSSTALPPGENPLDPLNKWLGGLQGQSTRSGESKTFCVPTIENVFFDWSRIVKLTEKPPKRLTS